MNYKKDGRNKTRKEIKEQKRVEAEARNLKTKPEDRKAARSGN